MSETKKKTKLPLYLQLREVVRAKIESGEFPPGCAIPSENSLAEQYGINRITVRNAIDALVHEGSLKRVQGRGVFVVGQQPPRSLDSLGGFRQTMIERDQVPQVKILVKARRQAGGWLASKLGIDAEDELYYIKRLNLADGEPVSMEETFIPYERMTRLDGIDLSVFTLYEVYGFYGIKPTWAKQTLDLAVLEPHDARMLGVEPDATVMLMSCVTYDENDRPIEYSRTYMRSDKCTYTVYFKQ